MVISIMQPYLFPYIGYFQMISCSDYFVIADDVQFIKKGWINRNRILVNNEPKMITLPLNNDHYYLNINERYFENKSEGKGQSSFLNKIYNAYHKAPEFNYCYPLVERIIKYENYNVAEYLTNSLIEICAYLDIGTEFLIESDLAPPPELDTQESIIYVCKKLNATCYINAIGGTELYSARKFRDNNIALKFIKTNGALLYKQFYNKFVPGLSIIDVMMFNSQTETKKLLKEYHLIDGKN